MQNETIHRPRSRPAIDHSGDEEEGSGAALAQASAIAQVARDSAQACKTLDAQKELDCRHNEPGQ